MSATVINSTSPEFTCTTYQCTLDAEDIDTSYEYESNYTSSCDSDISSISFTSSAGTAGEDGEDGRGISSISRTSGDGSEGTTDTYTITYTDGTTSTFDVYNGADGADGSDGSDGNTITTGSGVPSGGSDGDLYVNTDNYDLYENQSGSWVVIGNIKGDTGDTGDTGPAGSDGSDGTSINWLADSSSAPASPSENDAYYNTSDEKSYIYDGSAWQTVAEDGIDGDQWTSGSGSPSDTTTLDYDSYYLNTDNGEVSKKAEGSSSWSVIATLSGAKYTTTSSTSIDLSSYSIGDSITIELATTGMSYTVGQILVVANSSSIKFYGEVTSYDDSTPSITLEFVKIVSSGSASSWDVNISGNTISSDSGSSNIYQINLPASTTVSGRISGTTVDDYPTGWSLSDGSAGGVTQNNASDLIIDHDVNGECFEVKVMYEQSTDIWVTLTGDGAYTQLSNDIANDKIELQSLTTQNVKLRIHLIFG